MAVESEHYSTASSNSDAPGPVGVGIPATAIVVAAAAAGETVNDLTPKQLVPPQSPLMTAVPKGRSEAHTKGHGQKPRQPPPPVTPTAEGLTLFSNRIFCTKINNLLSDIVDLICRVIQGSVIGPLMFLIHINEPVVLLNHFGVKVKLFAVDVKLYIKVVI